MKNRRKKIGCLILSVMLLLSIAACGKQTGKKTPTSSSGKSDSTQSEQVSGDAASKEQESSEDNRANGDESADQPENIAFSENQNTSGDPIAILETAPKTKNATRPWVGSSGTKPANGNSSSGDTSSDVPGGAVESSTHSMLQTYIYSPSAPIYQSKKEFLPSVGYYPNGNLSAKPTDTMFDTFIFLASPGFHHGGGNGKYGGVALMTKATMEAYYIFSKKDRTKNGFNDFLADDL